MLKVRYSFINTTILLFYNHLEVATYRKVFKYIFCNIYFMIVQAYSLDQLAQTVRDSLLTLKLGEYENAWKNEARVKFYAGSQLITKEGNLGNLDFLADDLKLVHYLMQSKATNTYRDIFEYPDPLVTTVYTENPGFFLHTEWLTTIISDVGTLSQIVARQNPKALERYLPLEIRALRSLEARAGAPVKRDFEIWFYCCHLECNVLKKSLEILKSTLSSVSSL